MALGFLVVNMRTALCFTYWTVLFVLAFQDVSSQYYGSDYARQHLRHRRPFVVISSRSGIRRTYFASPTPTPAPPPSNTFENNATNAVNGTDFEKVRLDVYYETDCPDSKRFITRQLYPLYQEMEDVLEVQLVPYGKAFKYYDEEKKKNNFICQHGPEECYGNAVQSCAISLYPRVKEHLDFIECMEQYPRPSRSGSKCARRLSLDWDKIQKCANGEEGNRLLLEKDEKTHSLTPRLYFVPWIVVNGVFSEANQRMALRDLRRVVCTTYKGNHSSCTT